MSDMTSSVTPSSREPLPWQLLANEIVPRVLEKKRKFDPIRVWIAGCGTGAEAYTLAIILSEALGADEFSGRVRIYATDIDDDVLLAARMAAFDAKDIEDIPPSLVEKYFEQADGRRAFRKELRRCVIFGRHDLLHDAPISRVDIVVCRNTLMYMKSPEQARIISRLHFALIEGGFLFLGKAESLLAHGATFKPVDLTHHVFAKAVRTRLAAPIYLMSPNQAPAVFPGQQEETGSEKISSSADADLVVDPQNKQESFERIKAELENAYERLESTKEQMETTNEELQSTLEELEATNDLLQSNNEELETMNKELQSTNQDLEESGDLARGYTRELASANHLLESIFTALGHRVIVVDRALNVLLWNRGAEELWGVRADEALNAALPELGIGLPLASLQQDIDSILARKTAVIEREVSATDSRGKTIYVRVTLAPLAARDPEGVDGVIIITDDKRRTV
jgi:two-component system CheB/CheR fusion protein